MFKKVFNQFKGFFGKQEQKALPQAPDIPEPIKEPRPRKPRKKHRAHRYYRSVDRPIW